MKKNKKHTLFSCPSRLTILSFLATIIILSLPISSFAANVIIKWDPSDSETDGYKLYYGIESRNYNTWIDVGDQTSYTLTDLEPGVYHAAVTSYNSYGESDYSDEVIFTVEDDDPTDPGELSFLEIGEININNKWTEVEFEKTFSDPVVVAKGISYNGSQPAVLRIKNIDNNGFEIRIQEWDYLDGRHLYETVGYTVVEAGTYILPDDTMIEAGHFETDNTKSFITVSFGQPFNQTPVVIACITTYNGSDTVTGRIRNITAEGFQFLMQEQEANKRSHLTEQISYLAWEPSSGRLNNLSFEITKTEDVMKHTFKSIDFPELFNQAPVFIADMQTCDGKDTASLRWDNKDLYGVDVKIEEEKSRDSEIRHTSEIVGYMAFSIEN